MQTATCNLKGLVLTLVAGTTLSLSQGAASASFTPDQELWGFAVGADELLPQTPRVFVPKAYKYSISESMQRQLHAQESALDALGWGSDSMYYHEPLYHKIDLDGEIVLDPVLDDQGNHEHLVHYVDSVVFKSPSRSDLGGSRIIQTDKDGKPLEAVCQWQYVVKRNAEGNFESTPVGENGEAMEFPGVFRVRRDDGTLVEYHYPSIVDGNDDVRGYTCGEIAAMFFYKAHKANRDGFLMVKTRKSQHPVPLRRTYKWNERAKGVATRKQANPDFVAWVNQAVAHWMAPCEVWKTTNYKTGERELVKVIPPGHRSVANCLLEADRDFNTGSGIFTNRTYRLLKSQTLRVKVGEHPNGMAIYANEHVGGTWVRTDKKGIRNWKQIGEVDDRETDEFGLPTKLIVPIRSRSLPAANMEPLWREYDALRRGKIADVLASARIVSKPFARALALIVKHGYTVDKATQLAALQYDGYNRVTFYKHVKMLGIKRDDLDFSPDNSHMTRDQMNDAIATMRGYQRA
jgi:hypothetical protein